MFGTILKATNSSFQKGMTFCRSIYVKKVMKLLAFIFEQPSYTISHKYHVGVDARKAVTASMFCEQRRRPACTTAQSVQCLHYWLIGK